MVDRDTELARLLPGAEHAPLPRGLYPFRLSARCHQPAVQVLGRIAEVLRAIVREDPQAWPDRDGWAARLPGWFVAASLPERTPDPGWTLMNFVYWFEPDMRNWWWWNARVTAPDSLAVELACDEVDPPRDALRWLMQTAGVIEAYDE